MPIPTLIYIAIVYFYSDVVYYDPPQSDNFTRLLKLGLLKSIGKLYFTHKRCYT